MKKYDPQTKTELAIIGSVIVILIANILNLIM